ncbi:hypothetical protein R8Z50_23785 [Longispora sp. K20-0274]|uniref:hypothetical protein n=1 Tax=Longispora sp. K20-0274 TaxID=3088255 RepID=UPI00399A4758
MLHHTSRLALTAAALLAGFAGTGPPGAPAPGTVVAHADPRPVRTDDPHRTGATASPAVLPEDFPPAELGDHAATDAIRTWTPRAIGVLLLVLLALVRARWTRRRTPVR